VLIIVGGGFSSYILMNQEVKMLRKDVESLRDQVTRQYGVQREMNEKTNKEVQGLREWVEFHKGNIETWKMQQNPSQTER
jgi:hypothetical protein